MQEALAGQLPDFDLVVKYSSGGHSNQTWYDGGATSKEILEMKSKTIGLKIKNDSTNKKAVRTFILTRNPSIPKLESDYFAKFKYQSEQEEYNKEFLEDFFREIESYDNEQLKGVVLIDMVKANGSSIKPGNLIEIALEAYNGDIEKVNKILQNINFSSWGTGGNNLGSALATTKVLLATEDEEAAQAYRIQNFIHDNLFLGDDLKIYLRFNVRHLDPNSPATSFDEANNSQYNFYRDSSGDIRSYEEGIGRLKTINQASEDFINNEIKKIYGEEFTNEYTVKISRQYARNFEAIVQLINKETGEPVIDIKPRFIRSLD